MTKRLPYLDMLRCLAILLVLLLHVIDPFLCNPAFYGCRSWWALLLINPLVRTGVPLFFMISGALLLASPATREINAFYQKRLPRLLIPLAAWNLIYALWADWAAGEGPRPQAWLAALLNQGAGYHFWFVYALLALYLLAPFLRRITESCTDRQLAALLLLILFPTTLRPVWNTFLPVYLNLFDPVLTGYAGYFLLGHLLCRVRLPAGARWAVYAGGVAGYGAGALGNALTASSQAVPLPLNMGYGLNHYLCAAALFLLARTWYERSPGLLDRLARPLARGSALVFGVYWVHVLMLGLSVRLVGDGLSVLPTAAARFCLTAALSWLFAWCAARLPLTKKLLL